MTPSIALPSLYREIVTSFAMGKPSDCILNALVQKGVPEEYARTLMTAACCEAQEKKPLPMAAAQGAR